MSRFLSVRFPADHAQDTGCGVAWPMRLSSHQPHSTMPCLQSETCSKTWLPLQGPRAQPVGPHPLFQDRGLHGTALLVRLSGDVPMSWFLGQLSAAPSPNNVPSAESWERPDTPSPRLRVTAHQVGQ